MKTFQTAIATSLHFLKLPIILLVLFFNFSIGEPLPIPIGGNSVPRHLAQSKVAIGSHEGSPIDPIGGIGGMATRKFAVNDIEIGGQGGTETRRLLDIGGNGASTVPRNILQTGSFETASIDLPIGNQGVPRQLKEIGGNQTAPRSNADIGGIGGGQVPPRAYIAAASNDLSIGGQGTPRPYSEIGGPQETRKVVGIGGQQTAPRGIGIEIGGNSCPRC